MKQFKGKVAVITGGASGIGLALAQRFASEGMKLVLADIEAEALERACTGLRQDGAEVHGVVTDVSEGASVANLRDQALSTFGAAHVVCNNAGVQLAGPTWQLSEQDWRWLLGVNLWGVIHGVRAFVPHMLELKDECHIVNTSSMAGFLSVPLMSAYQVSKHGVVTLTETLAQELATEAPHIGVSVLCPAFVQTNLHTADRNRPDRLKGQQGISEELRQQLDKSVASLVAGGKPVDEIAAAVLDGIRERRLHILTHPEVVPFAGERIERVLEAAKRAREADA